MNRMMAIVEREMRKFFRSPMLMIMSLMMPILQLIIIGNAFGGKIVGTHVAVVEYDHGPEAVKVREAFDAVVERFSSTILNRDGAIDRATLASIVFSNDADRRDLEALIHPVVNIARDRFCRHSS